MYLSIQYRLSWLASALPCSVFAVGYLRFALFRCLTVDNLSWHARVSP